MLLQREGREELWLSDTVASSALLLGRPRSLWRLEEEVARAAPVTHRAAQAYLMIYLVGEENAQEVLRLLGRLTELYPPEVRKRYLYLAPDVQTTPEHLEALKARWEQEEGLRIGSARLPPGSRPADLMIRYYSSFYMLLFFRQARQEGKDLQAFIRDMQALQEGLARWHRILRWLEPYEAWLVLEYWSRGQQEGHERFISTFVRNGK